MSAAVVETVDTFKGIAVIAVVGGVAYVGYKIYSEGVLGGVLDMIRDAFGGALGGGFLSEYKGDVWERMNSWLMGDKTAEEKKAEVKHVIKGNKWVPLIENAKAKGKDVTFDCRNLGSAVAADLCASEQVRTRCGNPGTTKHDRCWKKWNVNRFRTIDAWIAANPQFDDRQAYADWYLTAGFEAKNG